MPTRVLVTHPQTLLRQALVSLVESVDDFRVIAHTGSSEETVRLSREFQPDIVLIDGDMPDDQAVEVVTEVAHVLERGHVLVLADRAIQPRVEATLRAGASGYTVKHISFSEFAEALKRVARAETVLHPTAASALVRSIAAVHDVVDGDPSLTPREKEILRLVSLGLQNKQIARRLDIGVDTVKTHVSRILHKLGVKSRTEAVVLAMKAGLVA